MVRRTISEHHELPIRAPGAVRGSRTYPGNLRSLLFYGGFVIAVSHPGLEKLVEGLKIHLYRSLVLEAFPCILHSCIDIAYQVTCREYQSYAPCAGGYVARPLEGGG